MQTFEWNPRCKRPDDLVRPVQTSPGGRDGPTRGQARGPYWRRCAPSWYVPAGVDGTRPEQRIVEQAVRLGQHGAITGWAALRWHGAAYFDGLLQGGRVVRPVPLVLGSGRDRIRPGPGCALTQDQLAPTERVVIDGVACATIQRALFDEMRKGPSVRHAVRACDMAAAARLISVSLMRMYVDRRSGWTGVQRVRDALMLAADDSWSPQESNLRMLCELDARLPRPLCNRPVFSPDGDFLGKPDLLDPEAGVVVEYDGADHLRRDRRRGDVARQERFLDHGLEYVCVVRGDLDAPAQVIGRIYAAHDRARSRRTESRLWTLDQPSWFQPEETLDEELSRLGLAETLTHT